MVREFNGAKVVVNDPQERWKADEEMSVMLRYNSREKTFVVTVPEAKPVSNEPKKQPVKVFEGLLSGIKGTITVKGNLKVGMDMPRAKAQALGIGQLRDDLNEALEEVFAYGSE